MKAGITEVGGAGSSGVALMRLSDSAAWRYANTVAAESQRSSQAPSAVAELSEVGLERRLLKALLRSELGSQKRREFFRSSDSRP